MPNTYTKIYVQTVFAVKFRDAQLHPDWRKKLFGVIGNTVNQEGCQIIAINGVEDHIHCFFILKPDVAISKIVQLIKGKSSKWINDKGFTTSKFAWQSGYGAFTYGQSQVNDVVKYIQNQELHHKKKTFREEYLKLLEKFDIEYDDAYTFKEID
jgi:REP element-mobilizing transposase RayT